MLAFGYVPSYFPNKQTIECNIPGKKKLIHSLFSWLKRRRCVRNDRISDFNAIFSDKNNKLVYLLLFYVEKTKITAVCSMTAAAVLSKSRLTMSNKSKKMLTPAGYADTLQII